MITRQQLLADATARFNARVITALEALEDSPYHVRPLRDALEAVLEDGARVHCFTQLWQQRAAERRPLSVEQMKQRATRRRVAGPAFLLRHYRVGVAHEIRAMLLTPSLNELVRIMPGWSSPQAFGRTLGNTLGPGASTALLRVGDPAKVCARLLTGLVPSRTPRDRVRRSRTQLVYTALTLVRPHLDTLPPAARLAVQDALATFPPAA